MNNVTINKVCKCGVKSCFTCNKSKDLTNYNWIATQLDITVCEAYELAGFLHEDNND